EAYDGRSDQYALAVTVYELLSGRLPAEGPTPVAILVQKTTKPPAALAELVRSVPETISAAVQKALSREPADRYANCSAFAHAVLGGMSKSPAAPAGNSPKAAPTAKIRCPGCRKVLTLSPTSQGKRVRCAACGEVFQVPCDPKHSPAKAPSLLADTGPAEQARRETPVAKSQPSIPASAGGEQREPSVFGALDDPGPQEDLWRGRGRIRFLYPAIGLAAILCLV